MTDGKLDEPMVHGCGKSFTYAQSYAKHAKGCDGTKPATSGRIAAATKPHERTPPARKRSSVRPEKNGHAPIRPAEFLKALRAERDKIDEAIRAVEALA